MHKRLIKLGNQDFTKRRLTLILKDGIPTENMSEVTIYCSATYFRAVTLKMLCYMQYCFEFP